MTIYAIVNSLLHKDLDAERSEAIWTLLSPSSILQGGNPYFVPDFASRFEARTALALRVGKLGKGIAPRFAYRYIDAAAPAVVFVAQDLLCQLRHAGLPWTSAVSYDRSLAIGKFVQMSLEEAAGHSCRLTLESPEASVEVDGIPGLEGTTPQDTISAISRDNTLKTGDIILIGLSGTGPEITPGWRVTLALGQEKPIRFNIR